MLQFSLDLVHLFAAVALEGPDVRVALVVVLQVVADHEGLSAALLLAGVRPLVGVGAGVLLEVAPSREHLAATWRDRKKRFEIPAKRPQCDSVPGLSQSKVSPVWSLLCALSL